MAKYKYVESKIPAVEWDEFNDYERVAGELTYPAKYNVTTLEHLTATIAPTLLKHQKEVITYLVSLYMDSIPTGEVVEEYGLSILKQLMVYMKMMQADGRLANAHLNPHLHKISRLPYLTKDIVEFLRRVYKRGQELLKTVKYVTILRDLQKPTCRLCGTESINRCACHRVYYCGRICQLADRKSHKPDCVGVAISKSTKEQGTGAKDSGQKTQSHKKIREEINLEFEQKVDNIWKIEDDFSGLGI